MSDNTPGGIRSRFFVYPTFETYVLALTTWFLETRLTFHDQVDAPITLLENLETALFCRLEAIDKFSKAGGACVFASVCNNTMTETSAETGRLTLTMQPPVNGTLCTANPNQSLGLTGEDELRKKYGSDLMAELAHALDQLATTGSLGDALVGQFPNFITSQLFSAPLNGPFIAGANAGPGAQPAIPRCVPLIGGCSFGVQLSEKTGWTIATTNPALSGGHNGPNFVRHNSARFKLAAGTSNLCATVVPPGTEPFVLTSRGLTLQVCDQRQLQQFSTTDNNIVPPH